MADQAICGGYVRSHNEPRTGGPPVSAGLRAQQVYHRLIWDIEKRWEERFGKDGVGMLRESLQRLLARHSGGMLLLSEGLVPPGGTVRATRHQLLAAGTGVAARQRMRDLVAQTEAFVRDLAGTLPHYPAWDMNRGFGP
jgi:hypothetical protein